jgi:hypothetical protein
MEQNILKKVDLVWLDKSSRSRKIIIKKGVRKYSFFNSLIYRLLLLLLKENQKNSKKYQQVLVY